MVAPFLEPRLTRSLVRIPNNSSDRAQHALISDLSRVSSLAAMVPVPRAVSCGHHVHLTTSSDFMAHADQKKPVSQSPSAAVPLAATFPQSGTNPIPTLATAPCTNSNVVSTSRKHPRPDESPEVTSTSHDLLPKKRSRVGQEYPPQAAYAEMPRRPTLIPATVDHGNNSTRPSASGGLIVVPVYAVPIDRVPAVLATSSSQQILQERDRLRDENLALRHRLLLFQQLFRNKERLTSVVRSLGIMVQE